MVDTNKEKLDALRYNVMRVVAYSRINRREFYENVNAIRCILGENRLGEHDKVELCPLEGSFSAASYPNIGYGLMGTKDHIVHFAIRVNIKFNGVVMMVRVPLTYRKVCDLTREYCYVGRYDGEVQYDLLDGYGAIIDDIMAVVMTSIVYHASDESKVWINV